MSRVTSLLIVDQSNGTRTVSFVQCYNRNEKQTFSCCAIRIEIKFVWNIAGELIANANIYDNANLFAYNKLYGL